MQHDNILSTLIQEGILPQNTSPDVFSLNQSTLTFHIPIQHVKQSIQALLPHTQISQAIKSYHTKLPKHPQIKNIIAIASGKGGVGKSTVTYQLAHTLNTMGAKVGVLDADIYGPSQPLLFGINEKPSLSDDNRFLPYVRDNIEVMTIGVIADTQKALMWRGPMISQALLQLYTKTQWGELDYLLIDLPPGTGDIPLTLLQKMPITCGVLISSPHELALADVTRCNNLFEHLEVPILDTLINMASLTCQHCQKDTPFPTNQKGIKLPFDIKFQDITKNKHPEFLEITSTLLLKLLELRVYSENPFAQIQVEAKL